MIWELNGLFTIYLSNLYQFLFNELRKNKEKIQFEKTANTLAFTVNEH